MGSSLNLDDNQATYQIKSYKPGAIQVNDQTFTRSIIVTPNQLIADWLPQTTLDLTPECFNIFVSLKPDVLLIGTGKTHVLLPASLYGELINAGIGIEVMNTSAACRTYNALSAENRRVVAALLIR